ncbi:uncharacterized protein ARMOST_12965 [Armillaria ostoyae]|uniref:Uncharacterized protein n=1 Tax=Armillaria ostoyae TaxID=47428 RepID=A0A284RLK5_ARMOS|nr:uncharacterized protein ARMOST_12965 [Armillaria ostoyae]
MNNFMSPQGSTQQHGTVFPGNVAGPAYLPISIATASDEVLRLNGNVAYMQVCLRLGAVEKEKEGLSTELTALKVKYELLQETIDKLIEKIPPPPPLQPNGLPQLPPKVPPLHEKDYPLIRFWRLKTYQAFLDEQKGETNGLATSKPKRGRPRKISDADDDDDTPSRHPYLEDEDGSPVSQEELWNISRFSKKCLKTLLKAELAPEKWGAIDDLAEDYFEIRMTNEFKVFQTCEGGWKLKTYITKMYPSWARHNHPAKVAKKRKQEPIENEISITPKRLRTDSPKPFLDTTNLFCFNQENEKRDEAIIEEAKPRAHSQEPEQEHVRSPEPEARASLEPITNPLDDLYETIDLRAPVHLPSDQEERSPEQKDQHMEEPKHDQEQDHPQHQQDHPQHEDQPQHEQDKPQHEDQLQHEQDQPPQHQQDQPQSKQELSGTIAKALRLATPGTSLTQKSVCMRNWIAKDPENNRLMVDFEAYYAKVPKDARLKQLEEAKAAKKVVVKKSGSGSTKNKKAS